MNKSNGSNESYYYDDMCDLIPHDYLHAKLILISILGSIVGLFGVFGNVTTALILSRKNMRTPNNLFLSTLAIFDTMLLVTAFMIYGLEYIIQYSHALKLYVMWLSYLRIVYGISHISQTGSVYTTVAVTLERYFAVIMPRLGERLCTKHGAGLSIVLVTCFAVLFNGTKFFEFSVQRNPYCAEDTFQAYIPTPSKLGEDATYGFVYTLWLTNIVMVFFPFLVLLIFNSIITAQIRRSAKQTMRQAEANQERQKLKAESKEATVVLIVMVSIFLICNLWGFVLALMERIIGDQKLAHDNPRFYAFSREAINFLAIINSSINFAIYCIFSKDFRKELVTVYCCSVISLAIPVSQDRFSRWRRISQNRLNDWKNKPNCSSSRTPTNSHQARWQDLDDIDMDEDKIVETCLIEHSPCPTCTQNEEHMKWQNSYDDLQVIQV